MNILVSGGCKNGKSGFAQELAAGLAQGGKKYYVATMIPFDDEDRERIRKHIEDRSGMGFETLEIGRDVGRCLNAGGGGTFLIDSVTALLTNEMFSEENGWKPDPDAGRRCIDGLLKVAEGAENAVFVTDYIQSDAERYDNVTEMFRKALADIDRALADVCGTVIELCAGNRIYHKGGQVL